MSECCATRWKNDAYEMIPKAWYSIIEEREMRARSPCCMPRSKRRIATLGDGCRSFVSVCCAH